MDLDLTIFTRFPWASEYTKNFKRNVVDREKLISSHLIDINYKSYKLYT